MHFWISKNKTKQKTKQKNMFYHQGANTAVICNDPPITPGDGASLVWRASDFTVPWHTCASVQWRTSADNDEPPWQNCDAPLMDSDCPHDASLTHLFKYFWLSFWHTSSLVKTLLLYSLVKMDFWVSWKSHWISNNVRNSELASTTGCINCWRDSYFLLLDLSIK